MTAPEISMGIREGLVPQWMADLLNGRQDDAAVDRKGHSITESGSDRRAEVFPTQTPTAEINVPLSRPEKYQIPPSRGRRPSIGADPKGAQGGRPLRRFPRAQARKLRKQGLSIRAIGARMGVPASTVADALRVTSPTKAQ